MTIDAKTVFLVSGQPKAPMADSSISSELESFIVVAQNVGEFYECIAEKKPGFHVLGFATLHDYETAAKLIHSALDGEADVLPIYQSVYVPSH